MSDRASPDQARAADEDVDKTLLISVSQTAKMIGLSGMTVRRRIHSGEFPSGRSGRKFLVPLAFVEDYVRNIEAGRGTVVAEEFAAARASAYQAEAVA